MDLGPDAYFSMSVLVLRCRDVNKEIPACFIDYEKALDNRQADMPIITNLHCNQRETVLVD